MKLPLLVVVLRGITASYKLPGNWFTFVVSGQRGQPKFCELRRCGLWLRRVGDLNINRAFFVDISWSPAGVLQHVRTG